MSRIPLRGAILASFAALGFAVSAHADAPNPAHETAHADAHAAAHEAALRASMHQVIPGFDALGAWRFDTARQVATALVASGADSPFAEALIGSVKISLGDYKDGTERLQKAKEAGLDPSWTRMLEPGLRALKVTEGYQEAISEHFIVRYPPGKDAILVPYAIETLEAARQRIGEMLGYLPQGRVVVEFYPSAATLAKVTDLSVKEIQASGTIALCKWNRLMVTTPRAVVFGYAWRDTLAHELAHLIIGGASQNRTPVWLHEGVAKYVETAWRGEPGLGISVQQQTRLQKAAKQNQLIPFSKLHPSIAKLPTQEATSLAFAEVFSFVEDFLGQRGFEGLRAVFRKLGEGQEATEAIATELRIPFEQALRHWQTRIKTRAIVDVAEGRPVKGDRSLEIKGPEDGPDDPLKGVGKLGRRYARAADLLYSRGRFKAAQIELKKAFEVTGSPLISAKLAMVALDNSDLNGAAEAARAAMKGAPELAGPNLTLAEVLIRSGNLQEASLPITRAIDINPFDPRIYQLKLHLYGQSQDRKGQDEARTALAWLQGRGPNRPPSLGLGSTIRVTGAPFGRVFLRHQAKDAPWLATGQVSPTGEIQLSPGRWEVGVLAPEGDFTTREFNIEPTPVNKAAYLIPVRPGD